MGDPRRRIVMLPYLWGFLVKVFFLIFLSYSLIIFVWDCLFTFIWALGVAQNKTDVLCITCKSSDPRLQHTWFNFTRHKDHVNFINSNKCPYFSADEEHKEEVEVKDTVIYLIKITLWKYNVFCIFCFVYPFCLVQWLQLLLSQHVLKSGPSGVRWSRPCHRWDS